MSGEEQSATSVGSNLPTPPPVYLPHYDNGRVSLEILTGKAAEEHLKRVSLAERLAKHLESAYQDVIPSFLVMVIGLGVIFLTYVVLLILMVVQMIFHVKIF